MDKTVRYMLLTIAAVIVFLIGILVGAWFAKEGGRGMRKGAGLPASVETENVASGSTVGEKSVITCEVPADVIENSRVYKTVTGRLEKYTPGPYDPTDIKLPAYIFYSDTSVEEFATNPDSTPSTFYVYVDHCNSAGTEGINSALNNKRVRITGYFKWGYSESIDLYPEKIEVLGR